MKKLSHVSVCICTFKRPALLERLLAALNRQETGGQFTISIVVVDNDAAESGRSAVNRHAAQPAVPISYHVESKQNIAMARNRAVSEATGDLIAFIDDDECPPPSWLLALWTALSKHGADGVLAPVDPEFEQGAPQWVVKGGFYDRPSHPTGMKLEWRQCRTGNVLLRRTVFRELGQPFNPECLSGEDQDFFRRCIERGYEFVWCHEAGVYEFVPRSRWKKSFLLRRALFRGIFAQRNHGLQPLSLIKAIISAPVYLIFLPFAILGGQTQFMKCLFKLSYHTGRLLGFFRLNPIRRPYVCD